MANDQESPKQDVKRDRLGRVYKGGMPAGHKTAKVAAREAGQAQAIAELREEAKLTAQRVLDELALHAFSNVQDLFDEQGNLKPLHTLTRAQAASIASFEVVKKNMTAGDGQTDTVAKVKVIEKTKVLEMLAKHFALLTEKVEHSGGISVKWQDE